MPAPSGQPAEAAAGGVEGEVCGGDVWANGDDAATTSKAVAREDATREDVASAARLEYRI